MTEAVASGRSVRDDAVAILEGVHFLGDDVGILADAADEQRGLLENRRADFLVVIDAKNLAGGGVHVIPDGGRGRKNVARAFDCRDH